VHYESLNRYVFRRLLNGVSFSYACHEHVMWRPWSATKQRLHLQSVAEISRHSILSGDRIRQCETSSGSRHKDTVNAVTVLDDRISTDGLFHASGPATANARLRPWHQEVAAGAERSDRCVDIAATGMHMSAM